MFSYGRTLDTADGGDYRVVEYEETRDINGRDQVDFETWMKLDMQYIDTWSLWLDLKIIFLTVFKGFSGQNAY